MTLNLIDNWGGGSNLNPEWDFISTNHTNPKLKDKIISSVDEDVEQEEFPFTASLEKKKWVLFSKVKYAHTL